MTASSSTHVAVTLSVYRRERLVKTVTLRDPVLRIGTDPRSQLSIDDTTASRTHAVVEVREDGPTLIDLGTNSGTWVNGARVNRCRLRVGDDIRIGTTHIHVERIEEGAHPS
ncbi:MAG TPA: FHA domain-containing protein [Polyangiaceae bacterium]|nr:FHA domain-containing protein [Polyangiaceae bacterium]